MQVTLDISATSIRLLSAKGRQVEKWGSLPLAPGLIRDGLILQPKAVGAAIAELFRSAEVPKRQVITSLTGLPFTYRILSLPRTKPAGLQEAIQRAARREMPLPPEELYLSWQALDDGYDEQDFFVLGVPRNTIDALVQTLTEAGVKPYLMDVKPLALARAANRGDAIIADLEADYFDIVLVANGVPAVMHAVTPRGEGASIEYNIQQLTDELSRTVKFYNSNHPQSPLSPAIPLLLTGELSTNATTRQLIQAKTEYPVELLTPPLKLPPDLPAALYAANIGLALKGVPLKATAEGDAVCFNDINLNILSAAQRMKTGRRPLAPILLPLALIIGIGPIFPIYYVRSQADTEAMISQTEYNRVSHILREAEQMENKIEETEAETQAVRQEHQRILSKGGDFADNLKLVTDAFAPQAYFTSIEIGNDQVTLEGKADNSFTVISYVTALETSGRFSEVRISRIDDREVTGDGAARVKSRGVYFTIVIRK